VSTVTVDDTPEKMEVALSAGQPARQEEFRTDKPTTSDQAQGAPTSLKRADGFPDFEKIRPVGARLSSGAPAGDKDWPPLP
jgi:hypothetical protein